MSKARLLRGSSEDWKRQLMDEKSVLRRRIRLEQTSHSLAWYLWLDLEVGLKSADMTWAYALKRSRRVRILLVRINSWLTAVLCWHEVSISWTRLRISLDESVGRDWWLLKMN